MHIYTIGQDPVQAQATQAPRPQSRLAELATRPFTPFNLWDAPRESTTDQPGLETKRSPRPSPSIKLDLSEKELVSEAPSSFDQWTLTHGRQAPATTTTRPQSMFLTIEGVVQDSSRQSAAPKAANRNSWTAGDRLCIPQAVPVPSTTSLAKSSVCTGVTSPENSVRNKSDSGNFRRDVRLDHWLHDESNPDCMDCHVESLLDKVEQSFDFDWQLRDGIISSDGNLVLDQSGASTDTRSESNYDETDHHPGLNVPEPDKTEMSAETRQVRKLTLRNSLRIDTSVAYHPQVPTAFPKVQTKEPISTHNPGHYRPSQVEPTHVYQPYRPVTLCQPPQAPSVSLYADNISSRKLISFEIYSDDHLTPSDDGATFHSSSKLPKMGWTKKHQAMPSVLDIVAPLRRDPASNLFDSVGQTMDEIEPTAGQESKTGPGRRRLAKRTGRTFGRFSLDQQRDRCSEAIAAAASAPAPLKRGWASSLLTFSRKSV